MTDLTLDLLIDNYKYMEISEDLHYIFKVPIKEIIEASKTFIIWRGNRNIDLNRIEEIFNHFNGIYRKNKTVEFEGTISYCLLDNLCHMVDGQHRFEALKKLYDTININFPIVIEVFVVEDKEEIREKFILINKSVPVPETFKNPNEIVDELFTSLTKKYSALFTYQEDKLRPMVNVNKIKSVFIERGVVANLAINSSAFLETQFINFNIELSEYKPSRLIELVNGKFYRSEKAKKLDIEVMNKIISRMLKKTGGVKLYFSIFKDFSWVGMFIDFLKDV